MQHASKASSGISNFCYKPSMPPFSIPLPAPERRAFCNRTLNWRSIRAIGFDMDYTLVHYRAEAWEHRAYEHLRQRLVERGWPVQHLRFAPELVALGLILDLEHGTMVKANRFGYVKRACHGTRMLPWEEVRNLYARTLVDLSEGRWVFLNTLFSLSEACMYMQLVDLLDAGQLKGALGYGDLYRVVRAHLDEAHMEGTLKAQIMADPEAYVELDPEIALTLLDQKHAGIKLMLITNSEWEYTRSMMSHAFDRYLPGTGWRGLFDIVIVGARKPAFFTQRNPLFEVINDEGHLLPVRGAMRDGGVYFGGSAAQVEEHLGLSNESILYVGDHVFSDVHVSKSVLRWRTGLVLRALEQELAALERFKPQQRRLTKLMAQKEALEYEHSQLRLQLQRLEHHYGPPPSAPAEALRERLQELRGQLLALDARISPLAQQGDTLVNERWGLLLRTGNDKSHLARQIERSADVYTSRVSNLLAYTPFVYMRSPRGSLPHDSGPGGGT